MKRFIFFDIDGTLVLTDGAGKRALAKAVEQKFAIENADTDIDYGGRTDLSICKEIFALNGIEYKQDLFSSFMTTYTDCLEAELLKSNGSILPGVKELLPILKSDDRYYLGLITGNIRKGAFRKLKSHGIDSYFDFGGFGDKQEHRNGIAIEGKEEAESFAKSSIAAKQMLVIGDTPHDIVCSRAIGASSIGVCTGYAPREAIIAQKPDLLLENLGQVEEVLSHFDTLFSE